MRLSPMLTIAGVFVGLQPLLGYAVPTVRQNQAEEASSLLTRHGNSGGGYSDPFHFPASKGFKFPKRDLSKVLGDYIPFGGAVEKAPFLNDNAPKFQG
ncbi:hypothetical protein BC835DRAFT_1375188 [Cytidiella melzeri]|nr:hypothetical protein BC835DRAFT_1375188 [Cytidiella melzeri]